MKIEPIATRHLKFRVGAVEQEIVVAVSAPYSPPADVAMAKKGYAACVVLTCDDPELGYEVFGADELEALQMALVRTTEYLTNLSADSSGTLIDADGQKYDPRGSEYMSGYMKLLKS